MAASPAALALMGDSPSTTLLLVSRKRKEEGNGIMASSFPPLLLLRESSRGAFWQGSLLLLFRPRLTFSYLGIFADPLSLDLSLLFLGQDSFESLLKQRLFSSGGGGAPVDAPEKAAPKVLWVMPLLIPTVPPVSTKCGKS